MATAVVIGKAPSQQAKPTLEALLFQRFPMLRLFHDGPVRVKVTDKARNRQAICRVALGLGDTDTVRHLTGSKARTKRALQQAISRLC